MNVLLTSAGRRDYLIDYFRQALAGEGKVFAANTTADALGMLVADDAFVVPPAEDPRFVSTLLDICATHKVGLALSLHDWEAPFIAPHLERFAAVGTRMLVSKPEVIDLCLDKWKTHTFVGSHGIASPACYITLESARQALKEGRLRFPLMVKPRCGQGSIGLEKVEDEWELETSHQRGIRLCARMSSNGLMADTLAESMLIQELVRGPEFVLDVVNDFEGRFQCCFVKQKLTMRAGETDIGLTVDHPQLKEFGRRLGTLVGQVGIMGVDVILSNGTPYLIEMNPRFTGHYPFAHIAGANIPAAMIAWAKGESPDPSWLQTRPGVKGFKGIAMHATQNGTV